jgi:hypothetical protein
MGFVQNLLSSEAGTQVKLLGDELTKLTNTPEEQMHQELEWKKAQLQHEVDMQNLSFEERKALLADTNSARKMNATVQESANATRLAKNVSSLLALGASLLTFCLFGMLMFGPEVDTNKHEMILYVLGVLSAVLTQIFGFYFGSSQGSADKTKIMQQMTENMAIK